MSREDKIQEQARALRNIIKEEVKKETSAPGIDLKVGDTILTGKFKNKKVVVKEFGVDDNGQPTVNGRTMLNFRIEKLMPPKKTKKKTK